MNLKNLVGSGDKIGIRLLPIILIGISMNVIFPNVFRVGGPSPVLRTVSTIILVPGVAIWAWSVVLILTQVPKGRLITSGPFSVVKHPLYTSVALLVLPWAGFLLDTWLGVLFGLALYGASRKYSPSEEAALSDTFGSAWDRYENSVKIAWL